MTQAQAIEVGATAATAPRRVDAATRDFMLRAGVVAGVIELAMLRVFTRTAIHIPALKPLHRPFEIVSTLARYAFFVSVLLLGANLLVVAWSNLGAESARPRTAASLSICFLVVAAAARAGMLDDVALAGMISALVIAAATLAAVSRRGPERAALALLAGAHMLAAAHTIVQDGALYGWRMESTGGLLLAGETAALLAVGVAGAAWGRTPTRREVVLAGTAGMLVLLSLVANGSTVKILLLWNLGLAGYYPSIVYAAAAGALTLALLGARRATDRTSFAGLVLLLVGGVGLHSTYQSGLVILGFLVLSLPAPRSQHIAREWGRLRACASPEPSRPRRSPFPSPSPLP